MAGITVGVLAVILLRGGKTLRSRRRTSGKKDPVKRKPCPLCASPLSEGEKVRSVVYPGKPDKLMHIFGCPHCEGGGRKKICPVCGKEVQKSGYVIARVFESPDKTHVHVLGCTGCRPG